MKILDDLTFFPEKKSLALKEGISFFVSTFGVYILEPFKPLKKITKGSKVQIFTDSKYVKSGITEWIHNWKKNGWKTANKKEVKNKELWTELDSLSNSFEIKWSWVKAHSSDKLNNEVDLLARTSANI